MMGNEGDTRYFQFVKRSSWELSIIQDLHESRISYFNPSLFFSSQQKCLLVIYRNTMQRYEMKRLIPSFSNLL